MASSPRAPFVFDKHHQNFFRLTTLILDVGTEVLREVLASYYPSRLLKDYLAEQTVWTVLDGLVNGVSKVISQAQSDLLYPPNGQDPDIKTFDITLLYTLIRNLNANTPANKKVWNQPGSRTTIEADVARIRDARNRLHGHVNSAAIVDAEYVNEKTALVKIYQRIIQNLPSPYLSQKSLQDKVDAIENEPMDQMVLNNLVERLKLSFKVDEIGQKVEDLRDDVDQKVGNLKKDVEKIETIRGKLERVEVRFDAFEAARNTGSIPGTSKGGGDARARTDELAESEIVSTADREKMHWRIEQTLVLLKSYTHDLAPLYIHTAAYNKAKTMLNRDRCLLISGIPGAGKTSMALELLQELVTEHPQIKPIRITSAKEWKKLVHPHENLCVYIDDFLGKYKINDKDYSEWNTLADLVLANIRKGNTSLLLTMRKSLLSGIRGLNPISANRYSTNQLDVLLGPQYTIDLSDNQNQLTRKEKKLILDKYTTRYNTPFDDATIDQICTSREIIGFPQSCKMLNTATTSQSGQNAFTSPNSFLTDELERLCSQNRNHFAALLLVLLNDGELTEDFGTESTRQEVSLFIGTDSSWIGQLALSAQALCGTYLSFMMDSKTYRFVHDVVEEVIFHLFVNMFPTKGSRTLPH